MHFRRQGTPRHVAIVVLAAAALSSGAAQADDRHRHGAAGDYDVIHDFDSTSATGGQFPYGALALGSDGAVYGTTEHVSDAGGPVARGGMFKLVASGRVGLARLLGPRDSAVIAADGGGLLGTLMRDAYTSDPDGCGEVVRATGPKAGTTLHRFFPTDPAGCFLQPVLTEGPDGSLYGSTLSGGANDNGTIFRLDPGGTATPLSALQPFGDPAPDGALRPCLASDGNLYVPGDTALYRITPGRVTTSIASLVYETTGNTPAAGLVVGPDGALYGSTSIGGPEGYGTIFRFDPATQALAVLHAFGAHDGQRPTFELTPAADGLLYGIAASGGSRDDVGAVFRIAPDGTAYEQVVAFVRAVDGLHAGGPLLALPDGRLVGGRRDGGAQGLGSLYVLTPAPTR